MNTEALLFGMLAAVLFVGIGVLLKLRRKGSGIELALRCSLAVGISAALIGVVGSAFSEKSSYVAASAQDRSAQPSALQSELAITATISFSEATYALSIGEPMTIPLMIDGANDASAWDAILVFDSTLLTVTAVSPGGFLASTGRSEAALGPLPAGPGQVAIGGYSYGSEPAARGAGVLALVTVEGLAGGETTANPDQALVVSDRQGITSLQPAGTRATVFDIGMTHTSTLLPGWNLRALAIDPAMPYTAQALLDEVNAQGGNCSEVDRWLNGGWDAHVNGLPFNDFSIELGRGYFLRCAAVSAWTVRGEPVAAAVPLTLSPGWNLVSVPHPAGTYLAQLLLDGITSQGGNCSEVDRWLNGGWDAHISGLPFNDFTIEPGQGYFVRCLQTSTFTP